MQDHYITKVIGAVERKLRKRTWRQRAQLSESAKAWHKPAMADNLRLCGHDDEAILDKLAEFDRAPLTVRQWLDYLLSEHGIGEALTLALGDVDDVDAIIEQAFEEGTALDIVAELWGISFDAKPAENAESGADPTKPATFPNATPAQPSAD